MREIKFRAWDPLEEEMYSISFPSWNGNIIVWENDKRQTKEKVLPPFAEGPPILLQYIGMRDMLLREIFEHDIVTNEHGTVGVIEYATEDYGCSFTIRQITKTEDWEKDFYDPMGTRSLFHEIKVIGNIYEDPELIKKGN